MGLSTLICLNYVYYDHPVTQFWGSQASSMVPTPVHLCKVTTTRMHLSIMSSYNYWYFINTAPILPSQIFSKNSSTNINKKFWCFYLLCNNSAKNDIKPPD